MFKMSGLIGAAMLLGAIWAPVSVSAEAAYDLLFRNGTLDSIDRDTALLYRRDVTNALNPEAATRDTGDIALSFDATNTALAQLEFRQDGKARSLGRFPASVGNPMIMYFYESVVRDMAETAGGSPFYIRNRVKDALVQTTPAVAGEAVVAGRTVPTVTVTLVPFADDPNHARMRGFGDLALKITMSEAVPGWYMSLRAETSPNGGEAVYRSELVFERLETAQ
ncbi:MAG: hypothetical protein AAF281_05225 [Pseudomonadota bacterium]